MVRVLLVLVVSALCGAAGAAAFDEPIVDHQPVVCSLPQTNPRICSYVADDGEVKRVRVYFRAEGEDAYYWSEMVFDGIQYCATLPVAKSSVRHVEYYIWVIDDQFESQRTRSYMISVSDEIACEYPIYDEDPDRVSNLVVYATSERQGDEIRDFEEKGIVRFVPVGKKK
jgi:hypothetical protein